MYKQVLQRQKKVLIACDNFFYQIAIVLHKNVCQILVYAVCAFDVLKYDSDKEKKQNENKHER